MSKCVYPAYTLLELIYKNSFLRPINNLHVKGEKL